MNWKSRKLWLTLISIAIATTAPLWVKDAGIYYGLVGFLAAACGLYDFANTLGKGKK